MIVYILAAVYHYVRPTVTQKHHCTPEIKHVRKCYTSQDIMTDHAGHGSGGSHHARLSSLQGQCTWDVVKEWH